MFHLTMASLLKLGTLIRRFMISTCPILIDLDETRALGTPSKQKNEK